MKFKTANFESDLDLQTHSQELHVGANFECEICRMKFKTLLESETHYDTIHVSTVFHCNEYKEVFASEVNLNAHSQAIHCVTKVDISTDDQKTLCEVCGSKWKLRIQMKNMKRKLTAKKPINVMIVIMK